MRRVFILCFWVIWKFSLVCGLFEWKGKFTCMYQLMMYIWLNEFLFSCHFNSGLVFVTIQTWPVHDSHWPHLWRLDVLCLLRVDLSRHSLHHLGFRLHLLLLDDLLLVLLPLHLLHDHRLLLLFLHVRLLHQADCILKTIVAGILFCSL